MINYDEKFKVWMRESLSEIRKASVEKWLSEKINNFIKKFEVSSYEEILNMISENDVVAAFFAKDPSKQGVHEETAFKYLCSVFGSENVKKLPKSGSKAMYVKDGGIVAKRPSDEYKSIDFIIQYREKTIVASHKYTKEKGGAQDNQRNDLISFIKHSLPPKNSVIFVALADGEYYTKNNYYNLNAIQLHSNSNNVFATQTHLLKEKLDNLLN